MKCTCGAALESLQSREINAVSATLGGTVKVIAYCCEKCGTVLGVESNPLLRDAQMAAIKKSVEDGKKLQEQLLTKFGTSSWM